MTNSLHNRPIIIKKVKKGGHGGGHHGGAWKVAYADFVTAMMAFFLLMWLLNATTQEQRKGISNYFGPPGDAVGAAGSGGILGGLSLEKEGNFQETRASAPTSTQEVKKEENPKTPGKIEDGGNDEAQQIIDQAEKIKFQEVKDQLNNAIQQIPDLKGLAENLIVDQTPEGLRIQVVDQKNRSMFPNGSADMYPDMQKILQYVEKIIEKLPNKISITGHTDAKPYTSRAAYTNWELSVDRANATRRTLLSEGLDKDRITYVSGKAETEPLKSDDPTSDQNRRISIVIHKIDQKPGTKPV